MELKKVLTCLLNYFPSTLSLRGSIRSYLYNRSSILGLFIKRMIKTLIKRGNTSWWSLAGVMRVRIRPYSHRLMTVQNKERAFWVTLIPMSLFEVQWKWCKECTISTTTTPIPISLSWFPPNPTGQGQYIGLINHIRNGISRIWALILHVFPSSEGDAEEEVIIPEKIQKSKMATTVIIVEEGPSGQETESSSGPK